MRDDQYLRLQALEEKLTEQFLTEADPDNWTGTGILPKDLTQQDRGDRYWCKKNAVATISLTIRIGSLIGMVQRAGATTPAADEGEGGDGAGLLDAELAAAETEAKRLLAKMERRSKAKTPQ
jgi:hypothetical protein